MAPRVAALLLLGVICISFARAEIVMDCCLTVSGKPLPLHILSSYILQEAGQGCEIGATAFITKVGRTLCVSHPSEKAWVRNHIKYLEDKKRAQQ